MNPNKDASPGKRHALLQRSIGGILHNLGHKSGAGNNVHSYTYHKTKDKHWWSCLTNEPEDVLLSKKSKNYRIKIKPHIPLHKRKTYEKKYKASQHSPIEQRIVHVLDILYLGMPLPNSINASRPNQGTQTQSLTSTLTHSTTSPAPLPITSIPTINSCPPRLK